MPWQEQVALVGGEIDPDTGLPAYREVVVTVPRQSGKTTLTLAWEIQRAIGWGSPQRIAYSAQTGNDARKKLVEDQVPVLKPHKKRLGITRFLSGMGNEAVEFTNGSRIVLLASSEDSGHGKTLNLAVRDELFADHDDRRAQSIIPAQITVADAQLLSISTAGTDASVPLNRLVEIGRAGVDAGKRSGIAYFEWSAPEGADMSDEDLWWSFMPALGHTTTPQAIAMAQDQMTEGQFRRAFGNLPTASDERLITALVWDAVNGPDVTLDGELVFGVDVSDDRSSASIIAVSRSRQCELVDHRPGAGTSWLAERLVELSAKFRSPVAYDAAGPVAGVVEPLEGLDLRPLKGREMLLACGQLYDDVVEARLKVRRHLALDEAVAGARRSFVGDAWKWVRRDGSVDISPLVALTVGLSVVGDVRRAPRVHVYDPNWKR